ncbi:hypothetical protein [Aliarcobacter butzleri]|uniref:hypothetical protein n=1 Tax=Aliarcobacter butzleri TaxID=28197 RepID=UPI001D19610D|nr:hypothetical protein [Aliarcobacter butzleri]
MFCYGGFHIIIPVVDRVRAILTSREQLYVVEKNLENLINVLLWWFSYNYSSC